MIKHHRTVTPNNKVIDEFELNPKNVPFFIIYDEQELSAISASNGKILLSGHYINIVRNTGIEIANPVYREWRFVDNVTVYSEYVRCC